MVEEKANRTKVGEVVDCAPELQPAHQQVEVVQVQRTRESPWGTDGAACHRGPRGRWGDRCPTFSQCRLGLNR